MLRFERICLVAVAVALLAGGAMAAAGPDRLEQHKRDVVCAALRSQGCEEPGPVLRNAIAGAEALLDIELGVSAESTLIQLRATGRPECEVFALDQGKRLVVDLYNTINFQSGKRLVPENQALVHQVRTSLFALEPQFVSRIVIDLAHPCTFGMTRDETRIAIDLSASEGAAGAALDKVSVQIALEDASSVEQSIPCFGIAGESALARAKAELASLDAALGGGSSSHRTEMNETEAWAAVDMLQDELAGAREAESEKVSELADEMARLREAAPVAAAPETTNGIRFEQISGVAAAAGSAARHTAAGTLLAAHWASVRLREAAQATAVKLAELGPVPQTPAPVAEPSRPVVLEFKAHAAPAPKQYVADLPSVLGARPVAADYSPIRAEERIAALTMDLESVQNSEPALRFDPVEPMAYFNDLPSAGEDFVGSEADALPAPPGKRGDRMAQTGSIPDPASVLNHSKNSVQNSAKIHFGSDMSIYEPPQKAVENLYAEVDAVDIADPSTEIPKTLTPVAAGDGGASSAPDAQPVAEPAVILPPVEYIDPLSQPVNIDFRDMELSHVVGLLAEKAGINVVAGTVISGTVTARLTNVPL
ncbi:MAG: hypothetical protein QG656_1367, partial [Candidatus Hydrogenedentes bacterium]|nr:hypothetical protein [Candidatus Hydrogenedentota bacterium]